MMKRSAKTKKQTQELQKSGLGTADLQAAGDTKIRTSLWKATSANGVDGSECVITQDVRKTTGTHSEVAAEWIINGAANARVWPRLKQDDAVAGSLAVMEEMAPRSVTEAMLAVQMIATNDAALMFLRRATLGQSTESIDANVLRATRLMRVFTEQLEAMQKLQGKAGQQKVTVEHVHVHEGGQAIVGAVSTTKGEGDGGQ